ncbi:MAG: Asp-tRNA(Asn)/Glu-tRNA(Gln) amidotransferase subunit GatC [Firmicutes bacterium]|nr:Asp-tRNA(Asn)/Glu-tRNA(Gln) amidotransferase subunit GatC [Bacillota bacterium]
MKITRDEVVQLARLCKLTITESEIEKFTHQLNNILQYVEKLKELDTTNVEPMKHVLPLQNVLREDKVQPCLPPEKVFANTTESEDGMFRVPSVLE